MSKRAERKTRAKKRIEAIKNELMTCYAMKKSDDKDFIKDPYLRTAHKLAAIYVTTPPQEQHFIISALFELDKEHWAEIKNKAEKEDEKKTKA